MLHGMKRKIITRAIWLLSLVSLLTDLASEMLYPIMPVYLQTVGFSVVLIGLLEGVAEATAGLSKSYFGRLSDDWGQRLPFVRLGYSLSALSKPLMALSVLPGWVFAVRTMERLGKGLRTAPRDALLADQSNLRTRGQVFGFHRSMDKLGGVLGPVAALIYLYYFPGRYVPLFLLAFIPGLVSTGLTFFLTDQAPKQVRHPTGAPERPASVFAFMHYWKASPTEYRRVVGGLLAFALFNSSDVFLLLKAKEAGLSDTTVIGLYIFYNLMFAVMAYPVGRLADRLGLKPALLIGLGLFALVYEGMATASHLFVFVALLGLYGVYAAATEGIAKAWISTICGPRQTATAIGTYAGLSSLCALVANSLAGWLWFSFGSAVTFAVTGAATLAVIVYLVSIEGRSEHPTALQEPQAVSGQDATGVVTEADDDWSVEKKPTVVMTRSAFVAMLLLIGSLGLWTVYMSFMTISITASSTASTGANARPSPKARPHLGPRRPTTDQTAADRPPKEILTRWPAGVPIPIPVTKPTATTAPASSPGLAQAHPVAQAVRRTPVGTNRLRPREARLYSLASLYIHFYNKPDKRSRKKSLFNGWNKIKVAPLAEQNGFFYVIYTNKKGQKLSGWLSKKNLKLVSRFSRPAERPRSSVPSTNQKQSKNR